jgi:hypothetical protein
MIEASNASGKVTDAHASDPDASDPDGQTRCKQQVAFDFGLSRLSTALAFAPVRMTGLSMEC